MLQCDHFPVYLVNVGVYKAGMKKLKNITLYYGMMAASSHDLQRNALASLVHFVVCKVN